MRSKFLLILAALAICALAPRSARAQDEVNFDYFFTALQEQGEWFGTDQYGYVFQPRAAATDRNWRPYADGYWSFTDEGWTWISYEDFGWATYHYGRWARLASVGWVWVPGYEWAPAWVSWRTSPAYSETAAEDADQPVDPESDFIGWAPLPPNAVLMPGMGLVGGIDHLFDIPPENYCFVPTPYFCAPALIVVIVVPARNYFCIRNTTNVTHCYYGDHHGRPRIYSGGPNFDRLQRRVPRPIPQFAIERRRDVPMTGRNAPALLNEVRGHTLHVIAPRVAPPAGLATGAIGAPINSSGPRPTRIKAQIARAEPASGWNTAGVQPQAVQAAREQFQREAAQSPRRAVAPLAAGNAPANATRPATPPAAVSAEPIPAQPARGLIETPVVSAAVPSTPDAYRQQQAAELSRRQQILAAQQRGAGSEAAGANEAANPGNAQREQQIEAQRQSQSEAQARMQALREQQAEQLRQAQANAQAQRQQQLEAQREAQADRQRRAQAEIQARAQAQREATRQQQQAELQRRAADAQRRSDTTRSGPQGTQTP